MKASFLEYSHLLTACTVLYVCNCALAEQTANTTPLVSLQYSTYSDQL